MRLGQNPMKWQQDVYQPKKVTVTSIVHIPFLDGYWSESFEVLKLCLKSMRENTNVPFDLMVFDNASCVEVQNYLVEMRRLSKIQCLLLSEHNLGKVGAWNILLRAAPGEIISYTDSDVCFLRGWLEASLDVLAGFPEAGIITAQPISGPLSENQRSTLEGAQNDSTVLVQEGNRLIPEKYVSAQARGLGSSPQEHSKPNRRDIFLSRGSIGAYIGGSHFQFTTKKKVLQKVLPLDAKVPLGDDTQLDYRLSAEGFWRLSTTGYFVHHMGNRVSQLELELEWLKGEGLDFFGAVGSANSRRPRNKFLTNRRIRRLLKAINSFSYKWLFGN